MRRGGGRSGWVCVGGCGRGGRRVAVAAGEAEAAETTEKTGTAWQGLQGGQAAPWPAATAPAAAAGTRGPELPASPMRFWPPQRGHSCLSFQCSPNRASARHACSSPPTHPPAPPSLPPLPSPPTHPQAARGQKRLQFLLRQAEVFQHFAPAAAAAADRKKKRGRHGAAYTEEQVSWLGWGGWLGALGRAGRVGMAHALPREWMGMVLVCGTARFLFFVRSCLYSFLVGCKVCVSRR